MTGSDGVTIERQRVEKVVTQLMFLSRSEEACRLLGIDGVLAEHVDITFLEDPLDYLAQDIASAVHDLAGDVAPVQATTLSTLVGGVRLCGLIVSRIDQQDLVERVLRHVGEQDR